MVESHNKAEKENLCVGLRFSIKNPMIGLPFGTENSHAINPLESANELAGIQRNQEHGALGKSALILPLDVHSIAVDEQIVNGRANIHQPSGQQHVTGVEVCQVRKDEAQRRSEVLDIVVEEMRIRVRVLSDDFRVDLLDVVVLSDFKSSGSCFDGCVRHYDCFQ